LWLGSIGKGESHEVDISMKQWANHKFRKCHYHDTIERSHSNEKKDAREGINLTATCLDSDEDAFATN
jgi:predicted ATPase